MSGRVLKSGADGSVAVCRVFPTGGKRETCRNKQKCSLLLIPDTFFLLFLLSGGVSKASQSPYSFSNM